MRKPGSNKDQQDALDEVAQELTSCPVCGGYLRDDVTANWDLRVVRARSCGQHGYFFIKWNPLAKIIVVTWINDKYMPDL